MGHKPDHRSRFKRVFRAFKDVAPRPVNERFYGLALRSGSDATPGDNTDQDTAPFMEPWAMIDEVQAVVMPCGKIAYRGAR